MSETEAEPESKDEETEEMILEATEVEEFDDIDIQEISDAPGNYGESY